MHALAFVAAALAFGPSHAQDPARGAMLHLRSPDGQASCVSCHGPDPSSYPNTRRAIHDPVLPLAATFACIALWRRRRSRRGATKLQDG
ncbi:hypothetical protein [Ramlibacter sp.]|uniref:hypothetical protein n=1 Tax=Ramlibacter sp. TaxID=1917967 RepID=UPI003D0C22DB